ncbi:MAG: ATP-dependent DNA helicase [bacterium]|nr:ATP-dependent DNA helicase [bacterium]
MNLSRGLNEEQRRAIRHLNGPALIIAGAGSGKTAIITRRIAWLIAQKKAKPEEILALTFTDKAAREMEERVDLLVPYGYVQTNIMTFHALGDSILKENALEIGLTPDFTVMSNFQQIIFIKQIFEKLKLKYYAPLGNPYKFIDSLTRHFSRLKDELIDPKKYLIFARKILLGAKTKNEKHEAKRILELANAYKIYIDECKKQGKLDYGDQINFCVELFKKRPHILADYQERFHYILVDEYQDTNFAQNELLGLLGQKHKNVMVVGDDDQSIYRFRGAAISNILSFKQNYPNTKQIVLNKNYRSTQKILDFAYQLIQHNNPNRLEVKNRISKKIIGKVEGKKPVFSQFETREEELIMMSEKIKKLIKSGIKAKEIAVLARKNKQLLDIARNLANQKIPFEMSQNESLFDRSEIRAIINFVNCLNDPNDSKSLYGLLIGDIYRLPIEKIIEYNSTAAKIKFSLEKYLLSGINLDDKVADVLIELKNFRNIASDNTTRQLIYKFITDTNYLIKLKNKSTKDSNSALKIQNIAKFFELIDEFESVTNDSSIFHFWQYLSEISASSVDILAEQSPLDLDGVQVLTVHKSKGLEFEAVFLIDMIDHIFPSKNQAELIKIPDKLIKISSPDNWHMEEERRLFYVAATRAKKHLFLSASFNHGGIRRKKTSPFIFEAFDDILPKSQAINDLPYAKINNLAKVPPQNIDLVKNLFTNGWLHLSPHQIDDYLRNPKEFWFLHVLKVPRPIEHNLIYGSAIHKVIEFYFTSRLNKRKPRLVELFNVLDKNWINEGFISIDHEKKRYKRAKKVIKNFFNREQKSGKLPIYVEKPFSFKLNDIKVVVAGRYDAVYIRSGKIEIRDFKTGQKDSLKIVENALKSSIQLGIYGLAWEKTQGQPPSKLSLDFLDNNILVSTDKIRNEAILSKISKVADGIRANNFKPKGKSFLNIKEYF